MDILVSYDQLKNLKAVFGAGAKFKIVYVDNSPELFLAVAFAEGFGMIIDYLGTQKPETWNTDFPDSIQVLSINL